MNSVSELNTKRLLALTKAALYTTIPDESLFVNTSEADWNEIFELSAAQGVMVLSFIGAMRLPEALYPPLALKLRWIASVDTVEKRYRHVSEAAESLSDYFQAHNIRMLLFKGLSLSRLYPVPASREFGDIDIFLCGKAKEGDVLLERIVDKKSISSKKHVNYSYRGILIENHHTFLNHGGDTFFHCSQQLEKHITTLATASVPVNENLLFPSPEFNVLHATLHMLVHLQRRIVLRHLCDLAVLFKAYKGTIDFVQYRNTLSEADLLKPADALISLSIRYLGLNPEDAPPYQSDRLLEDRLWNDLLNPEVSLPPDEKRSLLNVFIYKIRLIRSNRWKYELMFPGKFWRKILYSSFLHILHPGTIGRL